MDCKYLINKNNITLKNTTSERHLNFRFQIIGQIAYQKDKRRRNAAKNSILGKAAKQNSNTSIKDDRL